MEDADGRLSISETSVPTIEQKNKEVGGHDNAEWNIIDRKALRTIRYCLAVSVAFNISKETTTEGLMQTLAKL